MQTEYGSGFGISVGSEPDSDSTSFNNANAAGWARNWFILAVVFIIWVAVSGRRRG
jgi:hypothetical protein